MTFETLTSPLSPGDICPPGYFCIEGTHTPEPCSNGTYMNHTGGSQCYVCPAGYFCVNRDRADPCYQGYYCPEGTGADLQPCPTGTFGNATGLTQEAECTNCTGTGFVIIWDPLFSELSLKRTFYPCRRTLLWHPWITRS